MPSGRSKKGRSKPPWRRKPSRYSPPEVKLLWERVLDGEMPMEQAIEISCSDKRASPGSSTEGDEPV